MENVKSIQHNLFLPFQNVMRLVRKNGNSERALRADSPFLSQKRTVMQLLPAVLSIFTPKCLRKSLYEMAHDEKHAGKCKDCIEKRHREGEASRYQKK